jgi:hypothetical protein
MIHINDGQNNRIQINSCHNHNTYKKNKKKTLNQRFNNQRFKISTFRTLLFFLFKILFS